jgi:hypothetical protein
VGGGEGDGVGGGGGGGRLEVGAGARAQSVVDAGGGGGAAFWGCGGWVLVGGDEAEGLLGWLVGWCLGRGGWGLYTILKVWRRPVASVRFRVCERCDGGEVGESWSWCWGGHGAQGNEQGYADEYLLAPEHVTKIHHDGAQVDSPSN